MKYSKLADSFNSMKCSSLFEIAMVNGDYLLVDLSVKYKKSKSGSFYPVGINFSFDVIDPKNVRDPKNNNYLPVFFDGCITGKNGYYFYPFDECFSLDEHLQEIYSNVIEGFLIPHNLLKDEE